MILTEFDAGLPDEREPRPGEAPPSRRERRRPPSLAQLRRLFDDEPVPETPDAPTGRGANDAGRGRAERSLPPGGGASTRGIAVSARGLDKAFGARQVLQGIDLDIAPGEFVAIVGRSGCGKSTLLRLAAGLETASGGRLTLDGTDRAAHRDDDVRLMFQDARLLPWKRVLDNVALGLEGADGRRRAREALAEVGLADRADEWPAVLSGGQRQRVALARALVHAPRLLLLDEPLGALDALTRIEMQRLIERLWRQHGFTALLVTHDVAEAVALGDRVVLIEEGRIALDEPVALARPRLHTHPALAAIEDRVLRRVLREEPAEAAGQALSPGAVGAPGAAPEAGGTQAPEPRPDDWRVPHPAAGWRWAV